MGSGDGETVQTYRSMDTCNDKIVLPCDSEELLMVISDLNEHDNFLKQ